MNKETTIAAISTAPGVGGIAVARVSGPEAIHHVNKIFRPRRKGTSLLTQPGGTVLFGTLAQPGGEVLDEVVVTVFRAPHSYTGEDTVEISCHGSLFIQQQVLKLLLEQGCALAAPGEFSQRAFLNGKMDLSQAEAVADLIASTSAAAHRMALNQMRGNFSGELAALRGKLLEFVALIELELDFNEEDVQFADRAELKRLAAEIENKIARLAASFSLGNVLKNGIPVALVGETNVGKSTLLNVLLNEERAIVSDVHGTTRDVIEDCVNIEGVIFRFIDTAGIRNTDDKVENLGIERTYQKIEQASIILWVIDCTQISEHIEWLTERIAQRAEGKKIILVFNKVDKVDQDERAVVDELFTSFDAERIYISAKKRINTDALQRSLLKAAQLPELQPGDVVVSNMRHYEALTAALAAIRRVDDGLDRGISHDFLSQDIRECMHYIGLITGEITTDEVLGTIFGRFCTGK